jgi:hypothetical protein
MEPEVVLWVKIPVNQIRDKSGACGDDDAEFVD